MTSVNPKETLQPFWLQQILGTSSLLKGPNRAVATQNYKDKLLNSHLTYQNQMESCNADQTWFLVLSSAQWTRGKLSAGIVSLGCYVIELHGKFKEIYITN